MTQFLAIDSEGVTLNGEHILILCLAANANGNVWSIKDINGLSTDRILRWMLDELPTDYTNVGYAFTYDITKILEDLMK